MDRAQRAGASSLAPVSNESGNTLGGTYNTVSLHHDAQRLEPRHTGGYRAVYRRYGTSAAGDGALVAALVA